MTKATRAKAADQYVDKVAGNPQNKEEMYDIAADLMPWLTQSANGGDPELFYEQLPAAQNERIKKLTEKIGTPRKP